MKTKGKKFISVLLVLLNLSVLFAGTLFTASAADDVCKMNGVGYATLEEAIAAADDEKLTTIDFLADTICTEEVSVTGKNIIINTNKKSLTFDKYLSFDDSVFKINGNIQTAGISITGRESDIKIYGNVVTSGTLSCSKGNILIKGNIESTSTIGLYVNGWGTIFVDGNVIINPTEPSDSGGIAVRLEGGGYVTVNGEISAGALYLGGPGGSGKAEKSSKFGYTEYNAGGYLWVRDTSIPTFLVVIWEWFKNLFDSIFKLFQEPAPSFPWD
ncbi:MAG: hypothetical protein FWF08_01110 [Oscillospiraceae bacterium]|nr:hypothetical protein [Oscillospiraceae bacterium]